MTGNIHVRFLSTLSLRRATWDRLTRRCQIEISIHALLAESDAEADCSNRSYERISIHALLAESDNEGYIKLYRRMIFLSTLSLRRATAYLSVADLSGAEFLSTLSLRRATRTFWMGCRCRPISIHALLAESDCTGRESRRHGTYISIHALLAESDS